MIRLAEDIDYDETRKVPLDPKAKALFIEVASNRKIDVALVDAKQMKEFDDSDTGDDVDIDWVVSVRNHEFEYEVPADGKKRYLLFWNSNERGNAIVAYKITPLP